MFLQVKQICVFVFFFKLNGVLLDDSIGCDSSNVLQDIGNSEPLDLVYDGDVIIKTFSDVKMTSIISKSNDKFDKLYIDAKLEDIDGRIDLIIFTTENFEQYVKEQTKMSILLQVEFECSEGPRRILLFTQPLKEGNYFPPEFNKDVYTFVIPTPLYKGFELTIFQEISARDDDLSGYEINFSSTDSKDYNILVGTLEKRDFKTSFASLELMTILLSLTEKIEFSIIATDTGNPPRSSSPVKVILTVDIGNRLPPIPRFYKTVVYGTFTEDLQLPDLEIVLDPATYSEDVSFKKISDDDDLFQIKNIENVVYVSLNNGLDMKNLKERDRLTFDVEASNNKLTESGRTAVSISFAQKKEVNFKKGVYEGKLYVKSSTLEIEDFEVLMDETKTEQLEFNLQEQYSDLFNLEQSENIVRLRLKPDLSPEIWMNINFVSFKLVATINSEEIALTNIIIIVTHTTLLFQKPAYIGNINSDGDLALEPIILLTNTSLNDVDIQLLQTEPKLFTFTIQDNQIVLKLNEDVNPIELQNGSYISLEVEAKESMTGVKTSCVVLISKLKAESVLKYEKIVYQAQITDDAKLIAENVVLDKDSYNNEIEFSLLGRDAKYFNIEQNENILILSLNDDFDLHEHFDTNAIWVEIKALSPNDKVEASAVVIVDIAHQPAPEFEHPYYAGELTKENVLNIPKIVLKMSTFRMYTLFDLKGDYSDFFEKTTVQNQIEIALKSELPEDIKDRNSIVLMLIASNNKIKGYSTIVINLPHSHTLSNIFKKTIQNGEILEDGNRQILKIDDVEFVKQYNVNDFTCKLTGEESKKSLDYTLIAPKNVIKLILAAEFSNEITKSRFYITFLLECQNKEDASISGSTVIFLNLPGRQTGCTTPEPPTFVPEFQNTFYNFFANPTFVGSLQSVRAVIEGSDAGVRYSLRIENEHLRSRINIDTTSGMISLSALTSPGRYYFTIIAENEVTHSQSQAQGRLDIESLIQCEDHIAVSNTLLIKYLEEETEYEDILSVKLENCEFYVFSIEPNNHEYVKIDSSTKMLTMIATDRENAIFSNMVVPQIEVKLKLDCSSENINNFSSISREKRDLKETRSSTDNRSIILTEDIIFAKDVTKLSIILVDINDNRPEFIFPEEENLLVGYPDEGISLQIFSEHIIQVLALDKDEGLNAKIRYSIQPNEHFQINPESGQVYPYENAMKGINEIDLIVYATDKDGASDGLSSRFTMNVKVLQAKHFVLLTFVNESISNVEALMKDARGKTGINFVAINHATVSIINKTATGKSSMLRGGTAQFVQKVWTYAFEEGVPITSNEIKRKLCEGSIGINILAQTFDEFLAASQGVGLNEVHNVTGYIAGLCVLAVMIAACIGFILWRHVYQKHVRSHAEPGNNLSSRGPMNQSNFNLKQGAEIDIQKQVEILSDSLYEPSFYSKRESVKILGTTTQESTDDGKRRQIEMLNTNLNGSVPENDDESESDSSNGSMRPRATVTFNELVERIHIESDDDEKNKPR